MERRGKLFKTVVVLLLTIGAFFLIKNFGSWRVVSSGPAPNFVLSSVDGSTVELSSLHGKVILVDFWARWCNPCVSQLMVLEQLNKELLKQPFKILAINLENDSAAVHKFVNDRKLKTTVLLQGEKVASKYGVSTIPHLVLINTEGKIVFAHQGPVSKELLREKISKEIEDSSLRSE